MNALNPAFRRTRTRLFGVVAVLIGSLTPALGQETVASKAHLAPREATTECARNTTGKTAPTTASSDPHADHVMSASEVEADHAAMGHGDSTASQAPAQPCGPATVGRAKPAPGTSSKHADHAAVGHDMPKPEDMHSTDHSRMQGDLPQDAVPREPIPDITPADRAAAFPDVGGHAVHDTTVHSFWLFDRLEGWEADEGTGLGWEVTSWTGTDLDRIWLRSEGENVDGTTESADVEALYGRAIARWWDVVAGVRHDFGEGPSQTFAAIGVQGLAPQWFELEATGYIGESGQTAAQLEAEYDTLFTNRLILQWQAAAEFYGEDDPDRGIGSGLSTVEVGLRLRYEFRREFAPYVGVVWERAYGDTADYREMAIEDADETRIVAGVRVWF